MSKKIKKIEFLYSEEPYTIDLLELTDRVEYFFSEEETIEQAIDEFLTEVDTKELYLDEEIAIHYEDDTIEFIWVGVEYDFDGSVSITHNNKTYYGYGQTKSNER